MIRYDGPGLSGQRQVYNLGADAPKTDTFACDQGIVMRLHTAAGGAQLVPWDEVMVHLPYLLERSRRARADARQLAHAPTADCVRPRGAPMDVDTASQVTLRALTALRGLEDRDAGELVAINDAREAALAHLARVQAPGPSELTLVRVWLETTAMRQLFASDALSPAAFSDAIDRHIHSIQAVRRREGLDNPVQL